MANDKKIIVLVIVALAFQLFTWNHVKTINSQVNNLQHQMHQLQSNVSSQVSSIVNTVQQMREDTKWWSYAKVDFASVGIETSKIDVDWQIKEYNEGEKLTFYYSVDGQKTFQEVEAVEKAKGHFGVTFDIKTPSKPDINIAVSRAVSTGSRSQQVKMEETKEFYMRESMIYYYITRSDAGKILTSDIGYLDISAINYRLFRPIHGHLNIHNNKQLFVDINASNYYYETPSKYTLERVFVENRDLSDRVLERWELTVPEYRDSSGRVADSVLTHYSLNASITEELQQVYLILQYDNDFTYEELMLSER